ncbi:MAG TPA: 2-hydroxychromene-2-carboxylate isomerase [Nevskiaceae bacterium]|nr:2-hydroxychromene-2-carboxylate isomerase [Nevskiaceae bacterium]
MPDPATSPRERARCYFDVISPFAYLQCVALPALEARLDIEYVPVLLAGLLQHWGQLGPAEIPPKRRYVYRYCTWLAQQQGAPMRFPPRHPFNPLRSLRLIIALGSEASVVRTVFGFIYGEGRDVGDAAQWASLCARLGTTPAAVDTLIGAPAVKQQLRTNTEEAVRAGVFGVPTLVYRDELFWGFDALEMLRAFLDDPQLFESESQRRLATLSFGATRK